MPSDAEVIATLNNLIETCRDGQEGFRAAAEGVRSAELRELFGGYALQRASFVGELQDEVRRLGGDPERSGSIVASLPSSSGRYCSGPGAAVGLGLVSASRGMRKDS